MGTANTNLKLALLAKVSSCKVMNNLVSIGDPSTTFHFAQDDTEGSIFVILRVRIRVRGSGRVMVMVRIKEA